MDKFLNRALIVTWALVIFMGGICLDEATRPEIKPVTETHTKIRYIDRPIYQPIKGDRAYILAQRDLLAAALPARLLQPARHK